ncbi:hypothetical protein [Empedobacter falsenii]
MAEIKFAKLVIDQDKLDELNNSLNPLSKYSYLIKDIDFEKLKINKFQQKQLNSRVFNIPNNGIKSIGSIEKKFERRLTINLEIV